MLSNYLQHQEWPHFPECLYKSSQGPGLWDTEDPGRELPKGKTEYYFCLRNYRGRERNQSFLHFMQDFMFNFFILFYFILPSALLHTFFHVQTLVGMCHFRKDVDSPLLSTSACHTASVRLDYSWGILMSLFILFSFPNIMLQMVSTIEKAGGGKKSFPEKHFKKHCRSLSKPSMSYEG